MTTPIDRYALLARLLRDLRIQSDLTQTDVASALGKPQSYVSKYESGERRVDFVELMELCRVLGVGLHDFIALFEKGEQ
ncbi:MULTISPECIES: helix-turn-helix domain-containing protein [Xanthomonas]|uniref:DNA-binding protein n=1 Tax=Xanthomonas cucurbitae TaxID=56453 RepID=A0A2S7DRN4_9XANT|nr:helix-turn-helix transcriptional regulator [Xanthomonas cucurbitae]PPU76420.1 DNA-binding protein [Xanthomonas cucurbitae]QHG85703.1 XRE family transcriptional regulator [Xanthomonas cucurbitae]WDM67562.1 helix-turn-helix domain-containing protein [Xanthomonas cucurbitae]WDM71438.1 helix-turn-helix domain-containing protein [Xanthomonas cucurbitae]WDM75586.1 helix-turn-helix domain-containing protein [Xanthomonas cucurbitae]